MILLLGIGLGQASDAGALSTWSSSAVEAVPFLDGQVGVRAAERLGLAATLDNGDVFRTDLDFVLPAGGAGQVDLHALALAHTAGWGALTIGRQRHLDARGWLPLDGLSLDVAGSRFFTPTVYAGRLWSPEPGATAVPTWVGGLNLGLRPPDRDGEASRAVALQAGWMTRRAEGETSHSLLAAASVRRPTGASASADAEIRLGGDAPGSRASLRATAWLGPHLALAPELRWEDLSPDAEISGLRTPMDWLGGAGYGAASLAATAKAGDISLDLSGGPVLHTDATGPGGLGRGSVGWRGDALRLGVFGAGAAIDGSWLAGGGLEAEGQAARLQARLEAGLFRFQPLDGADATLGEARVHLARPLVAPRPDADLALALDAAVGADRQLAPWARAALVLEGHLGGAP